MYLKKYLTSINVVFMSGAAYSSRFFARLFLNLALLLAAFYLWSTLYGEREEVRGYTLSAMFTYYAISFVISKFTSASTMASRISSYVRTGRYSSLLIKPMSASGIIAIQQLAAIAVEFVIPILFFVFLVLWFPQVFQRPANLPLFLVSFILGTLINTFIYLLVGAISFWTIENSGFTMLFTRIGDIMSGKIIPVNFFPPWLIFIGMFLPFRYSHFVPVSIYLGTFTGKVAYWQMGFQVMWVIVLFISYKIVFKKGVKKYGAVGG